MDFEPYFSKEWKSVASAATGSDGFSGCFDCNICFDYAQEPVVTLCGHLYCWPCIYKWLHVQSASLASDEHPQCPVCKADISHTTMVPLYGRGQASSETDLDGKTALRGMAIPPRPPACGTQLLASNTSSQSSQQLPYRNPYQNPSNSPNPYLSFEEASQSPIPNYGNHPVVGMFREMVYARVFGNPDNLYAYPNSYHLMGSISPRLRRQEMQADKSLNRISLFLFCCFVLCLIVF